MTGPDILDDTTDDRERLEAELVAQDRDAARVSTTDIDERRARHLVNDLIEDDMVRPIPDQRVFVQSPVARPSIRSSSSPPGAEMGEAYT